MSWFSLSSVHPTLPLVECFVHDWLSDCITSVCRPLYVHHHIVWCVMYYLWLSRVWCVPCKLTKCKTTSRNAKRHCSEVLVQVKVTIFPKVPDWNSNVEIKCRPTAGWWMHLMPGHFRKLFWTTADLLSHVSPNQTAAHARLGQLVPGLGWNRGVL